MKIFKNYKAWAILIFVIALAVRIVYLLEVKSNPFFDQPMVDELWNIEWAQSIFEKSFWGDEPYFRGPLYPYFLAILLKLVGSSFFWARLAQMIISAGSVVLGYLLAREYFSEKVARLTSVFHAIYGTLIFYEAMFLIPVIFVFLNLLALLIIARNRDNPGKWPYFLAGLVFGLSAIARPNVLLVVPILALWIFFHFRKKIETRSIIILLLLFFIGVGLPIAPVTVRNFIVVDDFILISSQGGINLYLGNNTVAEGLTMVMPEVVLDAGVPWDEFNPTVTALAEESVGHSLKPSEVSDYWSNKAKEFIFEHPGQFIGLTFRKLIYLLSGFENSDQIDIYNFRQYSSLLSILIFDKVLKFPFGIFGPLALVGLGLTYRRWRELAPLMIFLFAYIPTIILFLVTARHRLTLMPIILMFASFAIYYLWDKIKVGAWRKIAYPGLILIILLILQNINFFDLGFKNVVHFHYSLGLTYTRQGDYPEAIKEFNSAIERAPASPELHAGLGFVYYRMRQLNEAIKHYGKAVALDPDYMDGLVNLGICYVETGQYERAEMVFRRALSVDPDRIEPYLNLGEIAMAQDDYETARHYFLQAADIDPDDHVLNNKLGLLYGHAGDTATAYSYFRRSLSLNPDYSAGYLNWGNIYLVNGDTVSAIEKYNQAKEKDPLAAEPYYNMAILYIRMGELDKARESVNELLKINPNYEKALELKRRLGN